MSLILFENKDFQDVKTNGRSFNIAFDCLRFGKGLILFAEIEFREIAVSIHGYREMECMHVDLG